MPDGHAAALQKGVLAALKADATVTGLVGARIYDEPPDRAQKPYLRITDMTPSAWDTDSTEGAIVQIGIAAHTEPAAGREPALSCVEAVRAVLHRGESRVSVSGYGLIELIFQTYRADRDPSGRGWTAQIALQARLEAIA